jgi:2-aminoadipate transaminase
MREIAQLDPGQPTALYRQLYQEIREQIEAGDLGRGEKLPPTRELAARLGLNRATVSSAYALLEEEGLIHRHVGRGSFVSEDFVRTATGGDTTPREGDVVTPAPQTTPFDERPAVSLQGNSDVSQSAPISFATSRPQANQFPTEDFRASCAEVLAGDIDEGVLQLGSPAGYPPLRTFLHEQEEREGIAGEDDEILISNGCQQALDLIARSRTQPGDSVLVEEPLYPGLKAVLQQAGLRLIGLPVEAAGVNPRNLERMLDIEKPRLVVLTPNFQNPTGATMPAAARRRVLAAISRSNALLVENDIYGLLRYRGQALPPMKKLDAAGRVILLRSFSKVAFPGLRVGWITAASPIIRKLAEVKQCTDLHTDQLSQSVLLRFVESGRLEKHLSRVRKSGLAKLETALDACARWLPEGSEFTRPDGGMSLWVRLPAPLDAGALLGRARLRGVDYLPASYFTIGRLEPGAFRLSFGGLEPARIEQGVRTLGELFREELERGVAAGWQPASAMV